MSDKINKYGVAFIIPIFLFSLSSIFFSSSSYGQSRPFGRKCTNSSQCFHGQCANGRCAPYNGEGRDHDYCHHNDHCRSRDCVCLHTQTSGFCDGFENQPEDVASLPITKRNFCQAQEEVASDCTRNEECYSMVCADGWRGFGRCIKGDGKGEKGDYCHHDNHCVHVCFCPDHNRHSWGFCADWEEYPESYVKRLWRNGEGFVCL